jgi:hypothetical protein
MAAEHRLVAEVLFNLAIVDLADLDVGESGLVEQSRSYA